MFIYGEAAPSSGVLGGRSWFIDLPLTVLGNLVNSNTEKLRVRTTPCLPAPASTCVRKGRKKDGSFVLGPWAPVVECVSSLLNQVYRSLESCGSLAMTAEASLHRRGYLLPQMEARQAVRLLNSQRDDCGYPGRG